MKSCQYVFVKEFIKLSVNLGTLIQNVKLVELHTKYTIVLMHKHI